MLVMNLLCTRGPRYEPADRGRHIAVAKPAGDPAMVAP